MGWDLKRSKTERRRTPRSDDSVCELSEAERPRIGQGQQISAAEHCVELVPNWRSFLIHKEEAYAIRVASDRGNRLRYRILGG